MNKFFITMCFFTLFFSNYAYAQSTQNNKFLISSRSEVIFYKNFSGPIRENTNKEEKLYLSNLYLNIEGDLFNRSNFIVEFQPITSDLYTLGGFISIAESLEGIANDSSEELVNERAKQIDDIVTTTIGELDSISENVNFERIQVSHQFDNNTSIDLGRLRNPFSYWDDFSLFRNISAAKTDPISLEVQLRRTDYGAVYNKNLLNNLNLSFGVLSGAKHYRDETAFRDLDFVTKIDYNDKKFDIGLSYYNREIFDSKLIHATGIHFRKQLTYDFTIIGEYIYIINNDIDINTKSFYIQGNYDLSELLLEGLRSNIFLESYNSNLLKVDLDEDVNYRFAGTYLQSSFGFIYAFSRKLDLGAQLIYGKDEEGSDVVKTALKIDLKL